MLKNREVLDFEKSNPRQPLSSVIRWIKTTLLSQNCPEKAKPPMP
jgi:hypothetical protein